MIALLFRSRNDLPSNRRFLPDALCSALRASYRAAKPER
jgi:hypothetical protein